MPTPIQSPTIDSEFIYSDLTLIGNNIQSEVQKQCHTCIARALPGETPNMRTSLRQGTYKNKYMHDVCTAFCNCLT